MVDIASPEAFGVLVRQARQARGLSQEELAMLAAVGRRFVSDLERGKATAELGKTLQVSRALGISISGTAPKRDLAHLLDSIRANRRELEELGVQHLGIFGSTARGDNRGDSDVDLLVDYDKRRVKTLLHMSAIRKRLEEIIGRSVDVADRRKLNPQVAPSALYDVINAF